MDWGIVIISLVLTFAFLFVGSLMGTGIENLTNKLDVKVSKYPKIIRVAVWSVYGAVFVFAVVFVISKT